MTNNFHLKLLGLLIVFLLCAQSAIAQYTLTGEVTDASSGEILIGVSIFDASSERGTSTGIDGQYTLELPAGTTTLRFSSVGYVTQNIEISGSGGEEVTLNVELKSDVANLEELVVTGLASSVKRENLANAIETIDADELAGRANPETIDNALSGKLPGVNIRVQDGAPGGGVNVQLRGISTLGAGTSQPLYIIDGVYLNNSSISNGRFRTTGANSSNEDNSANRLADLNPDEIASIEVLKGPSAAAIYGQRANAGVIIINTKRGKAGDTKVTLEQGVGFVSALNLLGYPEWNEEKIDYIANPSSPFSLPGSAAEEKQKLQDARAEGRVTDFEKELYGNMGPISNTQVGVSGGNTKTRFYISTGFKTEDGIIENTGFERGTIRANLDHSISDNFRISSSSNFIKTDNQRGFTGNQNGSGASLGYALSAIPSYANLFPDSEGNYPNNQYFDDNPLAIIEYAKNNEEVTRFLQSVNLDADLYKGDGSALTLSIKGGFDYLNYNGFVYMPNFLQNQQANANPGSVVRTKQDNLNTNIQAILLYRNDLAINARNLGLTTQIGFARFDQYQNRQQLNGQGLTPGQTSIGQAKIQSVTGQNEQEVFDVGYFAQQEVNWDEKFIATIGGRLDRSSLNFDQEEYYFYPKASLAANITNFDFWTVDELDQLKLRIAYGETGGLPNYGNTFSTLNGINIGGNLGLTSSLTGVDPTLKPERAKELEFGTDISLKQGLVTLSATYYNKTVEDLILNLNTAPSTGINAIATNAATLENKGIELALGLTPVRNRNLTWETNLLYWKNTSEITELNVPAFTQGGFGASLGTYLLQEGYSPTTIVGNPSLPGEASLFTVYGDANPDFQMSFSNQLNFFQDFSFSFLLHYSAGGENINLTQYLSDLGGTSSDWNEGLATEGEPVKVLERLGGIPNSYIQDATFVKLREVSLYYNLPSSFLTSTLNNTVSGIRLGVSGNNLWMWTEYDSYDPEVSVFGTQAINRSVEVTPYPTSRRVMFNVKIDF